MKESERRAQEEAAEEARDAAWLELAVHVEQGHTYRLTRSRTLVPSGFIEEANCSCGQRFNLGFRAE